MKKIITFSLERPFILLSFVILVVSVSFFSCRKNEITRQKLDPKAKVQPSEIVQWLQKLPALGRKAATSNTKKNLNTISSEKIPFPVHWDKAEQGIIEDKHVVRVPISAESFLIFTKEGSDELMNAYVFKARNDKPEGKEFTGNISWISMQDYQLRSQNYINGHGKGIDTYQPQVDIKPLLQPAKGKATTKAWWDIFKFLWCFASGGTHFS